MPNIASVLKSHGVSESTIKEVIDSGYILRNFCDPFSGKTWNSVSDQMYGNKQFSGIFEIEKFVEYINKKNSFKPLPELIQYEVSCVDEIKEVLNTDRRNHYLKSGLMSFRGQTAEYRFSRKIPNPVRANAKCQEISILPGLYRPGRSGVVSFGEEIIEDQSIAEFAFLIEPDKPSHSLTYSYDKIRVEQHYGSQTYGLDISFDIETAIFFATHEFSRKDDGKAFYKKIQEGLHQGVIYCFKFTNPSVSKTEYLIKDFDYYKTHFPERIIRQDCGLPIIGSFERNIAMTDIDCVLRLSKDFRHESKKTPEYMFPNPIADKFYGQLLDLKRRFPNELKNIVEYIY